MSLTSSRTYIGLNFPALRRNWFSQLYFQFVHQSTTMLSVNRMKYPEMIRIISKIQQTLLWSILCQLPKFRENPPITHESTVHNSHVHIMDLSHSAARLRENELFQRNPAIICIQRFSSVDFLFSWNIDS